MSIAADQITIAIVVYKRRQFVKQAIASALKQTMPVRVIVVEDPSPDSGLEAFIKEDFGAQIAYFKSPRWRGQWGALNYALELCRTPWISLLHDDDFLEPDFVETIIDLERKAPGQALYFGRTTLVNIAGEPTGEYHVIPPNGQWRHVGLKDMLYEPPFSFPGQLINVRVAREAGGFREHSLYCGDWEMWCNLVARGGSAQAPKIVADYRCHEMAGRVTTASIRNGWQIPVTFVQHRRILALLPEGEKMKFDRIAYQRRSPMSIKFLLQYGAGLRPRLLAYHVKLHLISHPPHFSYALFQMAARIGGVPFVKLASKLWRRMHPLAN